MFSIFGFVFLFVSWVVFSVTPVGIVEFKSADTGAAQRPWTYRLMLSPALEYG